MLVLDAVILDEKDRQKRDGKREGEIRERIRKRLEKPTRIQDGIIADDDGVRNAGHADKERDKNIKSQTDDIAREGQERFPHQLRNLVFGEFDESLRGIDDALWLVEWAVFLSFEINDKNKDDDNKHRQKGGDEFRRKDIPNVRPEQVAYLQPFFFRIHTRSESFPEAPVENQE